LDEDAVDAVVAVEPIDFSEQLGLGHALRKHELISLEPKLAGLLRFVANVDLGGGIVADANRDQSGANAESRDAFDDFLFDLLRDGLAVDQACGHDDACTTARAQCRTCQFGLSM
jgi:hypothetical protein